MELGGGGVVSLQAQKFELSPSVGYHPHQKIESSFSSPDHSPHIGKKVSLVAFRQTFPKKIPAACIFSYTVMAYLKKLVPTKFLNTK